MKIATLAQAMSLSVLMAFGAALSFGQEAQEHPLVGSWLINEELSEDTDEAVEAAIIKAGGKVSKSWFKKKEKGRYRGGPEEQELYDRISYDSILRIDYTEPEFWFGYADTVEANGERLRAELELKPANFGAAVKVVRVYDRQ